MPPRTLPFVNPCRCLVTTALSIPLLLAAAPAAFANGDTTPSRESATELFERTRAAKQDTRTALLPQTRYTVRKQIESIKPVSWLERYGKVQIRELHR